MTELHQEQRLLLCNEYSDEELHIHDTNSRFPKRLRHLISSGRARTHAIGAAAIITQWPDHLSSILTYWWIGFGMVAVMVFLIYNSIIAFTVLPSSYTKPIKILNSNITENKSHENTRIPNIYMHVFVSKYEEFNINNYVPPIEKITNKFTKFKYNFIVISNDVTQEILNDLSDEQNNLMALNSLWTDKKIKSEKKDIETFTVKYIPLTKYMDNSPLKKIWRLLPYQYIDFLARCIAIWEKGGVAFNPIILTPSTPNSIYMKKLHNILGSFRTRNEFMSTRKRKIIRKSKNKLNNIRDIIDNLEKEDTGNNMLPDSLLEAENIQSVTLTSFKSKRNAKPFSNGNYLHNSVDNIIKQNIEILYKNDSNSEDDKSSSTNSMRPNEAINSSEINGLMTKQNLLPKFLEFIFHKNPKNLTLMPGNMKNSTTDVMQSKYTHLKSIKRTNDISKNGALSEIAPVDILNVKTDMKSIKKYSNGNESTKLIIDLKGNLIATETACHAFIGTIFSNILHHTDEESLTDFIIAELSLFCKGSLTTCNGVEVILL